MRLFAAAALVLAMSFPAVACDVTKDQVIATLNNDGTTFIEVPEDMLAQFVAKTAALAGVKAEDVVSAIVAKIGGLAMFGVETKDGCFSPNPIPLPGQAVGVGA